MKVSFDRIPILVYITTIKERLQWRIQVFLVGEGGANSQSGIILQTFCRKLHENERIWTQGRRIPGAPHHQMGCQ